MRPWRHMLIACLAVTVMMACGCRRTQRASPLITEYDHANDTAELDFWHGLADEPITTHNDAFHAFIIFANQHDPNPTYEERVAWLKEKGHLDAGFFGEADEALDYGTLARALVSILNIEGGLTMQILGPHPRYALRELIFIEMIPPHSMQQAVPGIDFLGIIAKAERYREDAS